MIKTNKNTSLILCALCDSVVNRFRGISCPFVARNRRREGERGLAALELAILLVFLLMLSFGAIEYGWMFHQTHQVNNAARAGARAAAREGGSEALVEPAVAAALGVESIEDTSITVYAGTVEGSSGGDLFRVTVELPYGRDGMLTGFGVLPVPDQLRASVTMAKET